MVSKCTGKHQKDFKVQSDIMYTMCVAVFMCPISPCPSWALVRASLAVPKPSSLQTTLAAAMSQRWSHTVPHFPSLSTSTRPSPSRGPAFRRTTSWKEKGREIRRETLPTFSDLPVKLPHKLDFSLILIFFYLLFFSKILLFELTPAPQNISCTLILILSIRETNFLCCRPPRGLSLAKLKTKDYFLSTVQLFEKKKLAKILF